MDSWLIGGNHDCDLIIDSATVSAHHCRLTKRPEGFFLEDLQSTNGTFVNGQRIHEEVAVSKADSITLGTSIPMPWPTSRESGSEKVVTIGGAEDNDIVLDFPMVSGHHARLILGAGGMTIEDLNSTNGTYIGSQANRIESAPLTAADEVFFGSYHLSARELLDKAGHRTSESHSQIDVVGESIILGRDLDCDQILDHPMISRHHARISRAGEGRVIEDLKSTNGTYVNGTRIDAPVALRFGDVISLGSYSLTLTRNGQLEKRDNRGRFTIEARDVAIDAADRRLVSDVSLTILASEFIGIMGPSGAGKSTLMSSLNGYMRPSRGAVLVNGLDLYKHYDLFRGQIGYVPQDDIIHANLSVRQALYYTARLRLPPDSSRDEIEKRIATVIEQLGLEGTENVRIGSPERRGISGGQRKRVNLAMELLTDPSILFLDEPTSGLSSEDALLVMSLLRELAEAGKTILLTIHQPSQKVYRTLDNLILIAKDAGSSEPGTIAYYGPADPDAFEFFAPEDAAGEVQPQDRMPEMILSRLADHPSSEWITRYQNSAVKKRYVDDRARAETSTEETADQPQQSPAGEVRRWWYLVERSAVIKFKDSWNTAVLMVQAPIIGLLVYMVFGVKAADDGFPDDWPEAARATGISVFLIVLSAVWFGCSNSAREIIGEWANYRRERMVNLTIVSYVASKFAILGSLCAIQCAVLLTIVRSGNGLGCSWLAAFIILFLTSMVGVGLGLAISAVARSTEFAIGLLPVMIIPMVILGGILQPVGEMNIVAREFCQLMPSRWGFEALLVHEAQNRPEGGGDVDMAEAYFPQESERCGTQVGILALISMVAVLAVAVGWILHARDIHKKVLWKKPADRSVR